MFPYEIHLSVDRQMATETCIRIYTNGREIRTIVLTNPSILSVVRQRLNLLHTLASPLKSYIVWSLFYRCTCLKKTIMQGVAAGKSSGTLKTNIKMKEGHIRNSGSCNRDSGGYT